MRHGDIKEEEAVVRFLAKGKEPRSTSKDRGPGRHGSARHSKKAITSIQPTGPPPVAEWRVHVHAARRRVMIIIITVQRLRRGHRHPSRLPRLDDMGWFIPCGLGDDRSSFIKEFLKFVMTREQVKSSSFRSSCLLDAHSCSHSPCGVADQSP